jgi:hypothetical protein
MEQRPKDCLNWKYIAGVAYFIMWLWVIWALVVSYSAS